MKERVALNWNRQKRIHGPAFEAIASDETFPGRQQLMVKALCKVDIDTCYGFLRDNERACREIFIQEAGPP
jgi:hypothetical protein